MYDGDDFAELDELDLDQIAREELFKHAIDFQEQWQDNLLEGVGYLGNRPEGPYKNTGEAINDVTLEPQSEGATSYKIGGDVVQLAVAEFGRVPSPGSPPPFDAIADWAREKQLTPDEGQTFDEMVDAIRFNIADRGLPAFAPGRAAFFELEGEYERRVSERVERELG